MRAPGQESDVRDGPSMAMDQGPVKPISQTQRVMREKQPAAIDHGPPQKQKTGKMDIQKALG